jgi:hypothetical protein
MHYIHTQNSVKRKMRKSYQGRKELRLVLEIHVGRNITAMAAAFQQKAAVSQRQLFY